jgi:hypothetical protein
LTQQREAAKSVKLVHVARAYAKQGDGVHCLSLELIQSVLPTHNCRPRSPPSSNKAAAAFARVAATFAATLNGLAKH